SSQVTIPANQLTASFPLNAVDDMLLDGTQTVTISETGASLPGFFLNADNVDVTDDELLTFTVSANQVLENAGPTSLVGRITRHNTDLSAPYTVTLSSNDLTELTVPASVTIPANESFVEFYIAVIDDTVFDGDQLVTLTAQAPEYGPDVTVDVTVLDLEPSLRLIPEFFSVSENGGSLNVQLWRLDQADLSQSVTVNLSSSDLSELQVPATVIIPANSDHVNFVVTVVDDTLLDGSQLVTLSAAGSAQFAGGNVDITVTDHETLTVNITPGAFLENAGPGAAIGTVTRSNSSDPTLPLTVTLTSNDLTELTVPVTVTIPAGLTSTTFSVNAVNDPVIDGPQNVIVTATATGYVDGVRNVTVLDHEPPVITGPAAVTSASNPIITWDAIPGALRYDVWIDDVSNRIGEIIRDINVTGTSFQPTEQLGVGRYRVWVRAYDSLERPGFWSLPLNFRVDTPPAITAPVNSTSSATGTFPRISWTAVANTAKYDLWVDNLTTGTSQVIRNKDLVTSSFVTTEDLGSGTFRAWVRSTNAVGEVGRWSNPVTFSVLAAPTLVSPTGASFDTTPVIEWTPTESATHYDLWVSNLTTGVRAIRNTFIQATSYNVTQDLSAGEYAVWVRAGSGTQYGPWSQVRKFSVAAPPVITSPVANGTVGNTPTFVWSSVTGAETYEIWLSHNDSSTKRVFYLTGLTGTSLTSSVSLTSGSYRVWVRAISTMGIATKWSSYVDFTVASATSPAATLPGGSLGGQFASLGSPLRNVSAENAVRLPLNTELSSPSSVESAEPSFVQVQSEMRSTTAQPTETPREISEEVAAVQAEAESCDQVMALWQETDWWATEAVVESSEQPAVTPETATIAAGMGLLLTRSPQRRREE
ncbi:MAG: hypothetical protein KDA85_03415, partial [Planctomycetaceae bacterium]|nr:hypothetical protein [Planctomycetaceae bacterium]